MCKDGIVSLKFMVIPLLEEIVDLLKIAFGPDGDMVMIRQKSPRETKVTKVSIFNPLVCTFIFTFYYCEGLNQCSVKVWNGYYQYIQGLETSSIGLNNRHSSEIFATKWRRWSKTSCIDIVLFSSCHFG